MERAGYLAHARTTTYQRRVAEGAELVCAHPQAAVSVSWGKDSVVLLHLVASVLPRVVAVNARYNDTERLPDTDSVRDAVLSRLSNVCYQEAVCPGEWEMYEQAGFFVEAETPAQRAAVKWWRDSFVSVLAAAQDELEANGTMLGLRADESRARGMNYAVRGNSYEVAGRRIVTPLVRWRARDVWAYLVTHNLPWLHMYDVSHDRMRARSAFVFATGGADAIRRHGTWLEWRDAYPEQFEMWLNRWPEMRRFI